MGNFWLPLARWYHDVYLKTDVLLLSDIFESFWNLCVKDYGLDPTHFYTSPGLAWVAALKMSRQKLELITDPDMHLMCESAIRGGVAMISHRFAESKLPSTNSYDPEKES